MSYATAPSVVTSGMRRRHASLLASGGGPVRRGPSVPRPFARRPLRPHGLGGVALAAAARLPRPTLIAGTPSDRRRRWLKEVAQRPSQPRRRPPHPVKPERATRGVAARGVGPRGTIGPGPPPEAKRDAWRAHAGRNHAGSSRARHGLLSSGGGPGPNGRQVPPGSRPPDAPAPTDVKPERAPHGVGRGPGGAEGSTGPGPPPEAQRDAWRTHAGRNRAASRRVRHGPPVLRRRARAERPGWSRPARGRPLSGARAQGTRPDLTAPAARRSPAPPPRRAARRRAPT